MKIAVDVTPILSGGENGGAKKVVFELLRGFANRISTDQFILLTTRKNYGLFEEFRKLKMQRLRVDSRDHPLKIFFQRVYSKVIKRKLKPSGISALLKKHGISVLFCPMTNPTSMEANVNTVAIVHDLQHCYYPSFFSQQELKWRNDMYQRLTKKATYVICVSNYTRESVIEKLMFPPEKVIAVHNCMTSRWVAPTQQVLESVLKKYNLEGKMYCFYPANLWPHKNHIMLLVAFNMFIRKYPKHELHLILTGAKLESSPALEDAIKQMDLVERVHFLSYIKEDELAVIWQNSHFLVFPSLFEGFGIPLIEAMKFGKPILASNITSIPEVAGNAALYFDPRKPDEIVARLRDILEDKDLYASLVAKGQEQLKRYDFDNMIDRYIQILRHAGAHGSNGGNNTRPMQTLQLR